MSHAADQPIDSTSHGEPMSHAADLSPDSHAHGVPMPDQTDVFAESTFNGDPMTDDECIPDTQRALTSEDAARATLTGIACQLGHDEVRVLARIAERLKGGMAVYGPLRLDTDTRNFRTKEAREELEDALVYLACAWLKTETHEVTR
jgi:hypothetical protein